MKQEGQADLVAEARRQMIVCNACRYCEGYCAVWQAIEWRRDFSQPDILYLANLCHDCEACLYACPFAPPHEYAVNPPEIFRRVRGWGYRHLSWPGGVGRVLGSGWSAVAAGVVAALAFLVLSWARVGSVTRRFVGEGAFYHYVPQPVMEVVFGALGLAVLACWVAEGLAYWRASGASVLGGRAGWTDVVAAIRDALVLRYLGDPGGCSDASAEEGRPAWRRWLHHAVFYGFLADFASTLTAAYYSHVVGWQAPYPVLNIVVVLGTAGGVGILVGTSGLWWSGRQPWLASRTAAHEDRGYVFVSALGVVALTGMVLLAVREAAAMGIVLAVHLGSVVALFVSAPYSKFMHFIFRLLALVRFEQERRALGG